MASDQLVWQIVKGHNSFMRKGLNGMVLSAEPGNLYNKHSYKYSGATSAVLGCFMQQVVSLCRCTHGAMGAAPASPYVMALPAHCGMKDGSMAEAGDSGSGRMGVQLEAGAAAACARSSISWWMPSTLRLHVPVH